MISESDPEREAEAESEDQAESEGQSKDKAESRVSPSQNPTPRRGPIPAFLRWNISFRPVVGEFYLHQYTEGDDDVPKWCPVKVYANGTNGEVRQAYVEYWSFAYSKAADGTLRSHQADLGIPDEQWDQVEPMDMIQFNDWNLARVDTATLKSRTRTCPSTIRV